MNRTVMDSLPYTRLRKSKRDRVVEEELLRERNIPRVGGVAQAVFWLARIISKVVGEWVVNPASPRSPSGTPVLGAYFPP